MDPTARLPIEPTPRIARIPAFPVVVPPAAPVAGVRDVSFNVHPKGARVLVDGEEKHGWFGGATFSLPVGQHTVEAQPTDKRCCNARSKVVNVTPGEGPMPIQIEMEIRPAILSLAPNAPPGARARCLDVGVTDLSAGAAVSVKLRETEQTVSCLFTAPDHAARQASVKLKAGEPRFLPWPE